MINHLCSKYHKIVENLGTIGNVTISQNVLKERHADFLFGLILFKTQFSYSDNKETHSI